MIITRTPYRISFFEGGTDYPAWSREHGGEVLVTAINKYCYLTCPHPPSFNVDSANVRQGGASRQTNRGLKRGKSCAATTTPPLILSAR